MINATNALNFTKEYNDFNLREILYAVLKGKTECQVCWGRELTKEELESKRREYKKLGYRILREDVYTSAGDWREPEYTHPPEYRAIISWGSD